MKKGIRCNETHFTNGEVRNQISFEFVSDDGLTPSSCTVRLGDIDPVTGKPITDLTFFREYYRVVDHQVHKNLAAERVPFLPGEKNRREAEKERFVAEFEEKWGYRPSKDNVLYHLDQMDEERWNRSLQSYVSDDTGESTLDYHAEFSAPARMDLEETVEMQALREVAQA